MSEIGRKFGSEIGSAVGKTIGSVTGEVGGFVNLLKDFNVIGFALALMMANSVAELANSFIDTVIMPTIQPIMNKVTGEDHDHTIQIGSVFIDLNNFTKALIKFMALAVVIFIIISFGVKITKPISWVSVRSVAPGVSL